MLSLIVPIKETISRKLNCNYLEDCVIPINIPFRYAVPEQIKRNSLNFFGVRLTDQSSITTRSINIDNISQLSDFISITDFVLADFEENLKISSIKQTLLEQLTSDQTIIHNFLDYYIMVVNNILVIIDRSSKLIIIQLGNLVIYGGVNLLITYGSNKCLSRSEDDNIISYQVGTNFAQITRYKIEPDKLTKSYIYKSSKINKQIRSVSVETATSFVEKTISNQIETKYLRNKVTNQEKLISKCMFSSEGIRQRAVFKKVSSSDSSTTEISVDDLEVYRKHNSHVLIDKLTLPRTRFEFVIGWKLAKSENGQNRIVKLCIPPEALIVMPISEDFFGLCQKERSDRAMVLDIEQPLLDQNLSVVPQERQAISCIADQSIVYIAGQEVRPDRFDPDPSKSCAAGIHFHRNRRAVFKLWIPEFSQIEC